MLYLDEWVMESHAADLLDQFDPIKSSEPNRFISPFLFAKTRQRRKRK